MTRWETLLSLDARSTEAQPATKATSHGGNAQRMAGEHLGQCHEAISSLLRDRARRVGGRYDTGGYDVDEPGGLRARQIIECVGHSSHRAGGHSG